MLKGQHMLWFAVSGYTSVPTLMLRKTFSLICMVCLVYAKLHNTTQMVCALGWLTYWLITYHDEFNFASIYVAWRSVVELGLDLRAGQYFL